MAKRSTNTKNKKQTGTETKELFPLFGEFDSCYEINEAARGLLAEGDTGNLKKLAEENGLEEEAESYINGTTEELCDPISAAIGKLKVEKDHEDDFMVGMIADFMASECISEETAHLMRKRGKRIREAVDRIAESVNDDSHKIKNLRAMDGHPNGYCVACSPAEAYRTAMEYYREEEP